MSDNPQINLTTIDDYIQSLVPPDDALLHALKTSEENGLPHINVSPNQGRLLYLLARLSGAKSILEIGTLGGFSTINLARALPDGGKLISLEYSPKHAAVAQANIDYAGLSDKVEIRIGSGLDLLSQIAANGEGPFDLFFIDADKENNPNYLDWSLKLSHPGSVILTDNVIRGGSVINPSPDDPTAQAVSKYNRALAANPRLESIFLPLARESIDGLSISIVK
ncbi:MAG: O-methyltransferase [Chloroflexota bacterium]